MTNPWNGEWIDRPTGEPAARRRSVLFGAAILVFGGLGATLAPTPAAATTTLQVVRGSGEFQTLETAITVTKPEALTLQWTTDQANATGGSWQVTNASAGNQLVASGDTPAPAVGKLIRFTLVANAFLQPQPPAVPVQFNLTIAPHNAAKQPLGSASAAVVVTQGPETPQPPVHFGPNAVFPSVEIVSYAEKIGVVPLTQLHYAGADVKLRVSNKGKVKTDPMWLSVKDNNVLMRQSSPQVKVSVLKPGAPPQLVSVHLDAILPPPTSQLPQDKQYSQWYQDYRNRCGVDLRGVLDWRGPQAQTPLGDHRETSLGRQGCPSSGGGAQTACQQQCFDEYAVDKPNSTGVRVCLKACQNCQKKCH